MHLKEGKPKTIIELGEVAENYIEAHATDIVFGLIQGYQRSGACSLIRVAVITVGKQDISRINVPRKCQLVNLLRRRALRRQRINLRRRLKLSHNHRSQH